MKKITAIALIAVFFGCSSNERKEEKHISYFNTDEILKDISSKDSSRIDSMYKINHDSIVHFTVRIDSTMYYVVEGDLLLNEYEYFQYKLSTMLTPDSSKVENALVGEIRDDEIVRWPGNYVIRYSIARNSFPSVNSYNIVKENILKATKEWEQTCNIKFFHDENKDPANILTPTNDLTFIVMGYNTNGRFIASAFFPYDPASKRRLLIDPSYFTSGFDKTGVLRHELGHALGFRHEHIRGNAPKVCQGEDLTGTINLTEYDPKSVMHYFCGGMGSIQLAITDTDKDGSQSIYGAPKN